MSVIDQPTLSRPAAFPVVAIGASAGGLDPLERFFWCGAVGFRHGVHRDPTPFS